MDWSRTGSHIPTNQCQSSAPSHRTRIRDDSLVRITGWICIEKHSHFKCTHTALRATDFSLNAQSKSTILVSVTLLQMRSSPGQPWVRLLGPCIVFLSSWTASLAGLSYPGAIWLLYTLASLTSFFFPPSFSKLTLQDTVFWETMCKLIFFHASTAFLLLPLLSFQGLKENTIQILKGYS